MRATTVQRLSPLAVAVAVAALCAPRVTAAQIVAIMGGKVYPVSGPPIENGTVIMTNGKITAVGANVVVPAGAQRVDAAGKWVTPGLINAQTILGVRESGPGSGYSDQSSTGERGVAAKFKVWEGINPENTFIPPQRKAGITTVGVAPSSGNGYVLGQVAVVDLLEGSISRMLVRAPVAMVGNFGEPGSARATARGELYDKWRELLSDAKTFALRKTQYESNQSRPLAASKGDLEALQPVVNGTMRLWLEANRATDIEAALALAKEFSLKIAITGGAEAWMVADKLAAAKVPVMTGAMNNIPTSFSSLGQRQENAAMLRAAGVTVVLVGNGPGDPESFNVRNIRQEAGNAVAYGMTWDDALRSITLGAADLLGVSDKLGSLQAGRTADVVIWSGDPFEFSTRAEHVFVRGIEYPRRSRQEELTDRYKTKPPVYRAP